MKPIFFFIFFLLLYKLVLGKSKQIELDKIDLTKYNFTNEASNLSDDTRRKYIFVKDFAYGLLLRNDAILTPIPKNLIYAILYQEASKQIINGVPNELLFGGDGLSIGFFQVTNWAVKEYNLREHQNLTYADCYNEYNNVVVGLSYLYYCWVNNKDNNFLTGKKYNGGIDETLTSSNKMATEYGNLIVKRFNIYKSIEGL